MRWGPRTLDLDIIDVAGFTSDTEQLTVPHPRAHQRGFVLVPWLAVDGDARLGGAKVTDLARNVDVSGVRKLNPELRLVIAP